MKPVVLTTGEPAGVGPELAAKIATPSLSPLAKPNAPIVVLGDAPLLTERANQAGLHPNWVSIDALSQAKQPGFYCLHEPLALPNVVPGQPSPGNAPYVLTLLDRAVDYCTQGQASAMVTAPLQKSALEQAHPGFRGHTEYLAQRCNTEHVVMMLQGAGMRVALATTHLPLAQVANALSAEKLTQTLHVLVHDLTHRFEIQSPRILVAGLNPHAGENGLLGQEEQHLIKPVIKQFQQQGHQITGPWPADTLFQPKYLKNADAVLAMYHDQGLPVLKFASFGQGVNITLGLPIVRTSVDHGTALDLAGTGQADCGSLTQAIELACRLGANA